MGCGKWSQGTNVLTPGDVVVPIETRRANNRTVLLINGLIIAAIIIITPKRIGHWFNNLAVGLKDMGFLGMVLISLCVGV